MFHKKQFYMYVL